MGRVSGQPALDLTTPLRLPRDAVGSTVEVYWAGDGRWFRATVVKCDYVNQAVCVQYEGEAYGKDTDGEWEPALAAGMRLCAPSPSGKAWKRLATPERAAAEALGWSKHSWDAGDRQPYSAVWPEHSRDKQRAAVSALGLAQELFTGGSASSHDSSGQQSKPKSAKLHQWAGHDGWMYKRGTGLITFHYISPDGHEYTSEHEAEEAYAAYEEENASDDDDEQQKSHTQPLSRAAKAAAAAAAAAALKGGPGRVQTKRPHAMSPEADGAGINSPSKKARAASSDGDGATSSGAQDAAAGGVSALDCSPGTSISGSFIDDSCVGRLIAVFWPAHVRWYEGEITAFSKKTREHRVRYTDGREEWSDLVACGRFLSDNAGACSSTLTVPFAHSSLRTHRVPCCWNDQRATPWSGARS